MPVRQSQPLVWYRFHPTTGRPPACDDTPNEQNRVRVDTTPYGRAAKESQKSKRKSQSRAQPLTPTRKTWVKGTRILRAHARGNMMPPLQGCTRLTFLFFPCLLAQSKGVGKGISMWLYSHAVRSASRVTRFCSGSIPDAEKSCCAQKDEFKYMALRLADTSQTKSMRL